MQPEMQTTQGFNLQEVINQSRPQGMQNIMPSMPQGVSIPQMTQQQLQSGRDMSQMGVNTQESNELSQLGQKSMQTLQDISSLSSPLGILQNPGAIGRGLGAASRALGFGKEEEKPEFDVFYDRYVSDNVKEQLERNYGLSTSDRKISEIADRGRQNMGIPAGVDDRITAMYVAQKKQDDPDFVEQFKMGRLESIGNDLVDRARGVGTAYTRAMNEFANISEGRDEYTLNKEFDDAVATAGVFSRFANNLVGEGVTGLVQLADNLVAGGAADRRIYDYMNKPETQEAIQDLMNREGVQSVLDRVEKNPTEARTLGDLLSIGELGTEFVSLGAAGRVGDVLQQGARQVIGEAGEQAIRQGVSGARDAVRGGFRGIGQGLQRIPGVRQVQRGLGSVGTTLRDLPSSTLDYIVQQGTNLNKDVRDAIIRRGTDIDLKKVTDEAYLETIRDDILGNIAKQREELSGIGGVYQKLYDQKIPLDKNKYKEIFENAMEKYGVNVRGGDIKITGTKIPPNLRPAIQSMVDYVEQASKSADFTFENAHDIRRYIDTTIGKDLSTAQKKQLQNITKDIRKDFDKYLKDNVEGLAELDKKFSEKKSQLDEIQNLFFKKGKDGDMVPRANINNIVKKLRLQSSEGPGQAMEIIRKSMPDIDQKIDDLAIGTAVRDAYQKRTGSQIPPMLLSYLGLGGLGLGITGGSEVSGGGGALALTLGVLSNPMTFAKILMSIGDLGKKRVAGAATSSRKLADEMIDKAIDGTFNIDDAKRLQNVIQKDKQVRDAVIKEMTPPEMVEETIEQVDELIGEYRQTGGTTDVVGTRRETPDMDVEVDDTVRALPDNTQADELLETTPNNLNVADNNTEGTKRSLSADRPGKDPLLDLESPEASEYIKNLSDSEILRALDSNGEDSIPLQDMVLIEGGVERLEDIASKTDYGFDDAGTGYGDVVFTKGGQYKKYQDVKTDDSALSTETQPTSENFDEVVKDTDTMLSDNTKEVDDAGIDFKEQDQVSRLFDDEISNVDEVRDGIDTTGIPQKFLDKISGKRRFSISAKRNEAQVLSQLRDNIIKNKNLDGKNFENKILLDENGRYSPSLKNMLEDLYRDSRMLSAKDLIDKIKKDFT